MDHTVKDIIQKSLKKSNEIRAEKRLEIQSGHRNLTPSDFQPEITDKEAKTLSNQCKSGKITVDELRKLCEAISSHGVKGVAVARASGPYLVTLLSGSSKQLAEY